jgi:hypothetical protein
MLIKVHKTLEERNSTEYSMLTIVHKNVPYSWKFLRVDLNILTTKISLTNDAHVEYLGLAIPPFTHIFQNNMLYM